MKQLIAIVEDEPDISELVSINLEKNGFLTKCFYNGKELFSYLEKRTPSLLILDLMLPDMDGKKLTRFLALNWEPMIM